MKRFVVAFALLFAFCPAAFAATLLKITPTTAVTASVSPTKQVTSGQFNDAALIQGTFTYGSGGTSADAWVQTSVDGGATWTDVCNFRFTTASARFQFNLSSLTPVTTEYVPTDGALAANTAKDGIVGPMWRVKYTTVGTYAGTTLQIDMAGQPLR